LGLRPKDVAALGGHSSAEGEWPLWNLLVMNPVVLSLLYGGEDGAWGTALLRAWEPA